MMAAPPFHTFGASRTTEWLAAGLGAVGLAAAWAPIRLLSAADDEAACSKVIKIGRDTGPPTAGGGTVPDLLNWALTTLDNPDATNRDRLAALWIVMGSIGQGWLR